jgi:hypothetical protein
MIEQAFIRVVLRVRFAMQLLSCFHTCNPERVACASVIESHDTNDCLMVSCTHTKKELSLCGVYVSFSVPVRPEC